MSAAPRGVLLLASGHVAGAHGAGIYFSARANSDAAQRGLGERAFVVGKLEEGVFVMGLVACSEAEIIGGTVDFRAGELARIHTVFGVPHGLEFAKGLNEFGTEHLGQQRRARLA